MILLYRLVVPNVNFSFFVASLSLLADSFFSLGDLNF